MHKFFILIVLSLGSLWFSSGFVHAQESLYYVQIIGHGGRIIKEKGPFHDYFDAQQWAIDWGTGNPKNLRLWKIVERKTEEPKTPLDQVMAQGVERLEYLLTKTKKVAKYSGMKIPSAGDVTGEYKQNIENSYRSAKALRDKMGEFAADAPKEMVEKMDSFVAETSQIESERLVMTEEAKIAKEEAKFAETEAKEKQKDVRETLDQIAKSTDPAERQRLTEEFKELQKSGKLKEAVLAEANYQNHRDHYETTQKILKEMEKSVADHKAQLESIVQGFRLPNPKPANWSPVGSWSLSFTSTICTLEEGGVASTDSARLQGTWREENGQIMVTLHWENTRVDWNFALSRDGDSLEGEFWTTGAPQNLQHSMTATRIQ
jgi:hypothetical protein